MAVRLKEEDYVIKNALFDYVDYEIDKNYYKKWKNSSKDEAVLEEFNNELEPIFNALGYNLCDYIIGDFLIKSNTRASNLIGRKDYQDAQNVFDFASSLSIWCTKNK